MKTSQEINFYCRPSKANKEGEAFIEMSIIINGERTYIKLQRKCKPEEFKTAMASKKSNAIKQYCDTTRSRVNDLLTEMVDKRIELTAQNLKECYQRGGATKTYTLDDLFGNYLTMISAKVPEQMSQDTYNRYVKSTALFYQYNTALGPFTPAGAVDYTALQNVQIGLAKIYDPATSCNYLQKLKAIFNDAFQNGKIPSNPAHLLKIDKGVKETILYLTQDQVDKIRTCNKYNDRLQKVADLFLFQCYTGMAYSDIAELVPSDFQIGSNGQIYIEKLRHKTNIKYIAVLLKDAIDIAKKYDYCLPVNSNQKYNAYLKEVGTLAGLDVSLTSHMARHTCCAYLINHRDPVIPNETIIKVMGWTNEKQLRHYAQIFRETVIDDVSKINNPRPAKKHREPGQKPDLNKVSKKYLMHKLGVDK